MTTRSVLRDAVDPGFLEELGEFVDTRVVPLEEAHRSVMDDPTRLYAPEGGYSKEIKEAFRLVRMEAAEAGIYSKFAPRGIGGGGAGALASYEAWEFLYYRYGPARLMPYQSVAHWPTGPSSIIASMTADQCDGVLPRIMSGESSICFGLTEPSGGSDVLSMKTHAVRDGADWIINGSKKWISNITYADYILIFAVTDDAARNARQGGISCFLAPLNSPGLEIVEVQRIFGHPGGDEAVLSFSDLRVPGNCVIGEVGDGFRLAVEGVSLGRMYNAGRSVGAARWALESTVEYTKQREAFGSPIAGYQGVSFQLADCGVDIHAGKSLARDCAQRIDRGEDVRRDLDIIKLFTTEMCFRVFDRCIQLQGGTGLSNESRLWEGAQMARILRIADGSSEIMRRNISRALLKGDVTF